MFLCSKEEPVTNNGSLYQRKADNKELILDQSEGHLLNRYVFINKSEDLDYNYSTFFQLITNQLNVKVFIILCWLTRIPGKSKVASRVIEKRYEKRNWNIFSRSNHYIAINELLSCDIKVWPPLGVNPLDGGLLLLCGDFSQDQVLRLVSDEDTAFMAKNKYFVPDDTFLARLEHNEKAVALYQANDELNNLGFILIGNLVIDIKRISKSISIKQIYEGDSAYKIFVD